MSNQKESLDDIARKSVEDSIRDHMNTREFKNKIEDAYKAEIRSLISRSERRAKVAAWVASLLIFFSFTLFASLEYLKIREKRTQIYEKYVVALDLVKDIENKIVESDRIVSEFESSINTKIPKFDQRITRIEDKITQIETKRK